MSVGDRASKATAACEGGAFVLLLRVYACQAYGRKPAMFAGRRPAEFSIANAGPSPCSQVARPGVRSALIS